jgi:hypothetical protein
VAAYAKSILGDDIVVPFDEGQDGVTYWMFARDPLVTQPDELNLHANNPVYRGQRMLYPTLAAPWRLGGEQTLLWGLLLTNLAVVFAGAYLSARLAQQVGAPERVGLVYALSPAVVLSVMLDLADGLAAACLIAFVLAVRRSRWGWATLAALAAVLAREQCIAAVALVALLAPGPRSRRAALVAVPAVAAAAWAIYLRVRLGWGHPNPEAFVTTPFGAYIDSYRYGWSVTGRYDEMVVALVVLAVAVLVVVRFARRRTLELAAAVPFALLLPFYGPQVVYRAINSSRSLGSVFVLLIIDWYAERARRPRLILADGRAT